MKAEKKAQGIVTILAALSLLASLAVPSFAYVRPGEIELVSVAPNGSVPDGESNSPTISADGRFIAFASEANDLSAQDTNAGKDVFLRDMQTGETELISVRSDGTQPIPVDVGVGLRSDDPSISANGRYVAFRSQLPLEATDVDTPLSMYDIYVHDRRTAETRLITGNNLDSGNGIEASLDYFGDPSISADGRFVGFTAQSLALSSSASIYVQQLKSGRTELVSVSSSGESADDDSTKPSLSADGRYVAFESKASNLDADATVCVGTSVGCSDVFVRDRVDGTTELVSKSSTGEAGNMGSFAVTGESISADGRYVAFMSVASNLVPQDQISPIYGPFTSEIFVHDRDSHRTQRVSVDSQGAMLEVADYASISGNGRFVAYGSQPQNADGSGTELALHDRLTGATHFITGDQAVDEQIPSTALSRNGRFLAFTTTGDKHVAGDSDGTLDVFRYDHGDPLSVGALVGGGSLRLKGSNTFASYGFAGHDDPAGDVEGSLNAPIGADLVSGLIAYREASEDLFARISVTDMPSIAGLLSLWTTPVQLGLRFTANGANHEVRVGVQKASITGPSFVLYRCNSRNLCSEVALLHGGYGTTGDEVVLSLPLRLLGLKDGGELRNVQAFSALGTLEAGAVKILDTLKVN